MPPTTPDAPAIVLARFATEEEAHEYRALLPVQQSLLAMVLDESKAS